MEILSIKYFCQLEVCDEVFALYDRCSLPLNNMETNFDRLLRLLRKGEMSCALDIVDGLSDSSLMFLPLAMVAVHLLAEVENWEKVSMNETDLNFSAILHRNKIHFCYVLKKNRTFIIYRALRNGNAADAAEDAEALLGDESKSWRDLVLIAELNIALSKDATSLLVKT
ncbi:hypothetical protein COOONC_15124 [Cooperia oncophora]